MWSSRFRALALLTASALAGCQVAPLYGTTGALPVGAVRVEPVTTRVSQEVRNTLIESLGRPAVADPLALSIDAVPTTATFLRDAQTNRATRGSVTVAVRYTLADGQTPIATGTERAIAEFDAPIQLFARQRAVRDAENRAARVAAERVRLAITPALRDRSRPGTVGGEGIAPPPERESR